MRKSEFWLCCEIASFKYSTETKIYLDMVEWDEHLDLSRISRKTMNQLIEYLSDVVKEAKESNGYHEYLDVLLIVRSARLV